ncbi:isocitrate/isopropylmalate dehydrogenase [Methanothermobacter sp. DSM 3267]
MANPTAMILSTALMLKHLKKPQEAQKIQEALERVLKKGVMTPDLGGTATTSGMADAVRKEVLEL